MGGVPRATFFKPAGVPTRELEQLRLAVDELEALRLVDLEGLSHAEAAQAMGVSRQTVGRVLEGARATVVDALVGGKAIVINGGRYRVEPRLWQCAACEQRWASDERGASLPRCPRCGSADVTARQRGGCCRRGPGPGCGDRDGRVQDRQLSE